MSDFRNFTKEFILEFIEIYKSSPCLWKIKSKEYSDRDKKNAAYEQLISKLREKCPEADKSSVVKKIDSMRGTFRKEYKKVMNSKKSGAGAEEVYKPRLWYFDKLLFLKDHEIARRPISTMFEASIFEQVILLTISKMVLRAIYCFQEDSLSGDGQIPTYSTLNETSPPLESRTSTPESNISSGRSTSTSRKAKNNNLCDVVLKKVNERLDFGKYEDERDIFAKHIANKLRKLPKNVETVTEKLILDVVYQAELGYVDRHTTLQLMNTEQNLNQNEGSATNISDFLLSFNPGE